MGLFVRARIRFFNFSLITNKCYSYGYVTHGMFSFYNLTNKNAHLGCLSLVGTKVFHYRISALLTLFPKTNVQIKGPGKLRIVEEVVSSNNGYNLFR